MRDIEQMHDLHEMHPFHEVQLVYANFAMYLAPRS